MKTDEIRTRFLDFFRKRDHRIVASDSLIPHNDPTLLFTGAGMNQFKEQFLGTKPADFTRAATCQKCLRTGDLDNVGVTRWHMTFFEMLGNFSFGDYFKKEACQWAWQFMLEEMGRDPEHLHITIYEEDDESFAIWRDLVGVPEARIWRFGEEENFWPESAPSKGPNGPCGPCTEILVDTQPDRGAETTPENDSQRFVEVWNLVLQQFDRQEGGELVPLPSKNIDTGMGLERMAAIMQGAPTNMDIDVMRPIVDAAADAVGRTYTPGSGEDADRRLRRIAEHVRAVAFCIADGALPDRYGRGYVVRRIIRRAALDARHLGVAEPVLARLVPVVEQTMGGVYPELGQRRETIANLLEAEERRFIAAIEESVGIRQFEEEIEGLSAEGAAEMSGERVFEFYDTHGIPVEFIEQRLAEEGLAFDRDGFRACLDERREQSRAASTMGKDTLVFKREALSSGALDRLHRENLSTEFVGYDATESEATVLAVVVGDAWVEAAEAGQDAQVLLGRTPFYARSGGQMGDVGRLLTGDAEAEVSDTILDHEFIVHLVTVERGRIARGQAVTARVDAERRLATARNHTATHLLQWALRDVLGEHVHQAGSEVSPERLRFDFTHPTALAAEEVRRVEDLVNGRILEAPDVEVATMPIEEAREAGAMALFGEKYADEVRVVSVGDFSMELCGGTHLENVGRVGLFKITAEESVAAGVRRITAVTGHGALDYVHEQEDVLSDLCHALKATPEGLPERARALQRQIKDLKNDLAQARSVTKRGSLDDLLGQIQEVDGAPVLAAEVDGADAGALREAADAIRQKRDSVVTVLGSRAEGKVVLIAAATDDLVARGLHAGNLIGEVARAVGGGGGGRPDFAQAGGKDADALPDALARVPDLVRGQLGGES
ncbi:MAG: alanine--tRNA ligase [Phycisphaerae bacterium]